MHQMETQGLTVHSGLLFCYFRYIPRERFLDPLARPPPINLHMDLTESVST